MDEEGLSPPPAVRAPHDVDSIAGDPCTCALLA
jgi:hypothetical protein